MQIAKLAKAPIYGEATAHQDGVNYVQNWVLDSPASAAGSMITLPAGRWVVSVESAGSATSVDVTVDGVKKTFSTKDGGAIFAQFLRKNTSPVKLQVISWGSKAGDKFTLFAQNT